MSTINRCPAHLFKPSGKWEYEVFLDYTGMVGWNECGYTELVGPGGKYLNPADAAREALRQATANGTSRVTISRTGPVHLGSDQPAQRVPGDGGWDVGCLLSLTLEVRPKLV